MRDPTKYCGLISLLLLFLSFRTLPQTHIPSGTVTGERPEQNSPYYIDGEIKIPRGKKLIIEPEVKIVFTGHHKLIVNGILEAKGTKKDSIYFFSSVCVLVTDQLSNVTIQLELVILKLNRKIIL